MSSVLLIITVLLMTSVSAEAIQYRIATGGTTGTYYQIGKNLAEFVAPPAGIELEVLPSKGSIQNVRDLRHVDKVKFALVQSDVYQGYIDLAAGGDREARQLIDPLRVILALYFEEMHFVVAADSRLTYIHEIKDKKIYSGTAESGSTLSAITLYKKMFNTRPRRVDLTAADTAEGYRKALSSIYNRDGEVDVVLYVAGQPVAQLDVPADAGKRNYKLLTVDPNHRLTETVQGLYYPAAISSENYKWLDQDVPALAVKTYLITYDYPQPVNRKAIGGFAQSLCTNFNKLLEGGHRKWKQVQWSPSVPRLEVLKDGWKYYSVTQPILASCRAPGVPASNVCTQERRDLSLCK